MKGGHASEQFCLRDQHHAMACPFGVELWGSEPEHLQAVAQEVWEEVDRLEGQLSAYLPTSDICWLNANAATAPVRVEPDLFDLLTLAAHLHEETGGAFDVTAGPLVRCWGFFERQGAVPDAAALAEALARVGMQHVHLDPDERTVFFSREGIEINLGAIGKGYALRQVMALIARYEVDAALVHSGGSTAAAVGAPPGAAGWQIGLLDPLSSSRRLGTVTLRDGAFSTSGQLEQSFERDGRRYGHILDPRTGEPVSGMACVWVMAPDAAEADALSTALFVLGPEGAREYCEEHPEVRAYLLLEEETAEGRDVRPIDLGLQPEEEVTEE